MSPLKLAAVFSVKGLAQDITNSNDSLLFQAVAEQTDHLPFSSLLLGSSPTLLQLDTKTCIGLYLVSERTLLNNPLSDLATAQLPGCVGIFPMVAKQGVSAEAADKHWHRVHAPLALDVHRAMSHYYQLSVAHRFFGPSWQGFALCCFDDETDLREKMYRSVEGKRLIAKDTAQFADTELSPRRVISEVARAGR